MKQRIFLFWILFFFWVFYFEVARVLFLIYNWNFVEKTGIYEAFKSLFFGIRLDLSMAGYLTILPGLVLIAFALFKSTYYHGFLRYYTWLMLLVSGFLVFADAVLYSYWGFRLDKTPLLYITSPRDALASVSIWLVITQVLLSLAFSFLFGWIVNKILKFFKTGPVPAKRVEALIMGLFVALLILPIRGGTGIAPINVGTVYYSSHNFANHAAINVVWNVGFSLANKGAENTFQYFDQAKDERLVAPYLNQNDTTLEYCFNEPQPNFVFLMVESFSSNVIEALGGLKGITPHFNQLSGEGILFSQMYAAGDRSDKGLLAILSGYPAQTSYSVISDAGRTERMAKLPSVLKTLGYKTSFYYGGDIDFANMRSYLISAGFDNIVSKDSFPKSSYNSKWGAHDETVFKKLLHDLTLEKGRFFKMIFTLSSHEPFEVPAKTVIQGNDLASKYLNSVHYTDSCIGAFISEAKKQSWWKNTVILIVADHGIRFPGNYEVHDPRKYRIPMLWLGGGLKRSMKVTKTASQIDIPSTILGQLNVSATGFRFSRNIFGKHAKSDAFYIFNNGIGLVNDTSLLVYDCTNQKALLSKNANDSLEVVAKAYIQNVYWDIRKGK